MWLYVPGTTSASAPGEGGSTSELTSQQAERLAQSVSWKTKPRQPRFWSTTWRRGGFVRLLSGATCDPSTSERGVAAFRDSLADIPASPSRTQAAVSGPTTPVTSGPPSPPGSKSLSPSGASSRTSVLICDSDSTKSPETFKAWATELRRSCLQRRKSARLTDGNASSSWPTARASYNENRNTQPAPSHGVTHGKTLSGEAIRTMRNWQTPNAAAEAPNLGSNIKNGPKSLLAQAQWATPVASDDGRKVTSASLQPGLVGQSSEFAGHLDPETTGRLSLNAYGRPRLNPRFVEWLMGWPEGWADLTSSTSSATASSRHRPPTHGDSSGTR